MIDSRDMTYLNMMNQFHECVRINVDEMADDEIFILFKIKDCFPRLEKLKIEKEKLTNEIGFFFSSKKYRDYVVRLPEITLKMQYRKDVYAKDKMHIDFIENNMKYSLDREEKMIVKNAQLQVKPKGFQVKTLLFKLEKDILFEEKGVFHPSYDFITTIRSFGLIMYRTKE